MIEVILSVVYAIAIFITSNVVAFPLGFLNGFLEARKAPLSPGWSRFFKMVEGAIEILVWIAITVHLFHQQLEAPYLVAIAAFGLAGLIGYLISVRIFNTPLGTFLISAFSTAVFCIVVGAYIA